VQDPKASLLLAGKVKQLVDDDDLRCDVFEKFMLYISVGENLTFSNLTKKLVFIIIRFIRIFKFVFQNHVLLFNSHWMDTSIS